MWVGVCLRACACDFLLVHVGELLFLRHVHLLHLHADLSVLIRAFLTSSNNDPYGSRHWDAKLIRLEPAVCVWLSYMKHFNSLRCLQTYIWHPKPSFSETDRQEAPPCRPGWPLISFLRFIFRPWCDAAHAGGAALRGPRSRPTYMWSGPTWSGIWPGPVGPCLGVQSWSTASLECQTFEVRLVKKKRAKAGRSLVKQAAVLENGQLTLREGGESDKAPSCKLTLGQI